MTTSNCIFLFLLLAVQGSIQKSNPASSTYRAAVVELKPIEYTNNATQTLDHCAKKMMKFIEQAAEREVDIVVFPEMSLTSLTLGNRSDLVVRSTLVPDPSLKYATCTDSRIPVNEALKKIACAAERNDIYVVLNLIEKELCSSKNCPSDGVFIYLTNVVFDRNGKVIARSRKNNLVDEYGLINVMEIPEPSVFDTDFGVTFGSVVCFDIMFPETWQALRKLNMTDIVHTSGWFSSMPFLTTIQMEAGWAYVEDVNLLSAGYNNIGWGDSGSGIYAGRQGVVTAILPLHHSEEMLIADVLKKNRNTVATPTFKLALEHDIEIADTDHEHHKHHKHHKHHQHRRHHMDMDGHSHWERDTQSFMWRFENFAGFETKLISENGFTVERLSHNGIRCEFLVNITNLNPFGERYRLLAFNGLLPVGTSLALGIRICAIVLCANDTIESCGHIWDTSVTLNSVRVTAIHVDNARTTMMPNTLRSDMMPLKNWIWDEFKHHDHIQTSIILTTPTQDLLTFGIWGRNFEKDARNSVSEISNRLLYLPVILILMKNVLTIF